MGSAGSSEMAVFALDPFVGVVPLAEEDVLFDEMLFARIGAEHVSVTDGVLESLSSQLAENNPRTHNFQKLLRCVLRKLGEARALRGTALLDGPAEALANALFVTRVFLRALISRGRSDVDACARLNLVAPAVAGAPDDHEGGVIGALFRALVDVLIDVPRAPATHALLTEACLFCQTLLSVQMLRPLAQAPVELLAHTLCSEHRADELAHALLMHHVYAPAPSAADAAAAAADAPPAGAAAAAGSAVSRLLRLPAALLRLPRALLALLFTSGEAGQPPAPALHSASLCLLLVLAQDLPLPLQPRAGGASTALARTLARLTDDLSATAAAAAADGGGRDLESVGGAPSGSAGAGAISFPALFGALCARLPADGEVLLLYTLLHSNRPFLMYALSRPDVDVLLLPLLRGVYGTATARAPPPARVYMLLIVLLILAQDRALADAAFATELSAESVDWYRERRLGSVSVGSLAVCTLCRLLHANLNSGARRDGYVSTNCLAILANLAPSYRGLHPHAAQSFVALYARLERRQAKLVAQERAAAPARKGGASARGGSAAEAAQLQAAETTEATEQMRTCLEAISAPLTNPALFAHNLNLVYALLERQELLDDARVPDALRDVAANLQTIVRFFAPRVAAASRSAGGGGGASDAAARLPTTAAEAAEPAAHQTARSAGEALAALEAASAEWLRLPALTPPAELRFTYEQESDALEFFTPYLWALVADAMSLIELGPTDEVEGGDGAEGEPPEPLSLDAALDLRPSSMLVPQRELARESYDMRGARETWMGNGSGGGGLPGINACDFAELMQLAAAQEAANPSGPGSPTKQPPRWRGSARPRRRSSLSGTFELPLSASAESQGDIHEEP